MAARFTITLCFLLCELICVIGGVNIYSQDCFEDRYCFSLIDNQGDNGSNLTDAQDSCRNIRSKLAEISDSQIQNYTKEFLKNAISFIASRVQKNVLINAQIYDNGTWFWVNGEPLESSRPITVNGSRNVASILRSKGSTIIASASPTEMNGYICEYPNTNASMRNCTFNHEGRCFVVNNSTENWFSARNICLPIGDLASLDWVANASDLQSLNSSVWLKQDTQYWIGLRKSWWIWGGSKSEVKYTYWKNDSQQFNSTHKCVNLSFNSTPIGQWMTLACNSTAQYLCLYEKRSKTTVSSPTALDNSTRAKSATSTNTLAMGLGVGLGMCLALFIIVVVILVVFIIKRRLLTSNNMSSQASPSSAIKAKSKPTNGIPYYTQVQKHKREDADTSVDNSPATESATTPKSQTTYAEVRIGQAASSPVADGDFPERQPVYINMDIMQ